MTEQKVRLNIKIGADTKARIQEAATAAGQDMSAFAADVLLAHIDGAPAQGQGADREQLDHLAQQMQAMENRVLTLGKALSQTHALTAWAVLYVLQAGEEPQEIAAKLEHALQASEQGELPQGNGGTEQPPEGLAARLETVGTLDVPPEPQTGSEPQKRGFLDRLRGKG